MYMPQHFEERDLGVLHALIRSHPLSTWVTQADGELLVNHVPFLLDPAQGEFGTLVGHVARANPMWQKASKSIVIFQGPQTYISPSWYPTKHAHGKVVPTWNYAVVHVHGTPRAIEDKEWLLKHVTKLSDTHESSRAVPWSVSDAPADFIQQMLKAIVGIQIPIAKVVGKWKTSQNRVLPDKLGTIAGLTERGDANAKEMAALVQRHAVPKEG
jgi:transcriptional regulator